MGELGGEHYTMTGNVIGLNVADSCGLRSTAFQRAAARAEARAEATRPGAVSRPRPRGTAAAAGDDGFGLLVGPLPPREFVEHGLGLQPIAIAAPLVALSLPSVGYRGLSARAALDAYNREHGGWDNREKRVTVGGLLEFVVAFSHTLAAHSTCS
jgi:hypothetical protein